MLSLSRIAFTIGTRINGWVLRAGWVSKRIHLHEYEGLEP